MQVIADVEVSLFVRDHNTGRLVFNSEAIRALGLSPVELKQRGYALNGQTATSASPDDQPRVLLDASTLTP